MHGLRISLTRLPQQHVLSSHVLNRLHCVLISFWCVFCPQLGDPTAAGNHLPPCPVAIRAVTEALQSGHTASYANALGSLPARQAIAGFHSSSHHDDGSSCTNAVSLEADHVVIANGCSGALELALTALLDSDSIVLVPEPGFPLYQVIAESHGATVLKYRLLEHEEWHVDLNHVHEILRLQQHQQSTTKSTTTSIHGGAEDHQPRRQVRAMIINNPSNPTGAVYSLQHLTEIVKFCQVHRLPIVADEVYGDLVFSANGSGDGGGPAASFVPMATVAAQLGRTVPVITASGIGKQFLLPGWRVGWLCFHDKYVSKQHQQKYVLAVVHFVGNQSVALLTICSLPLASFRFSLQHTKHFLARQYLRFAARSGSGCQAIGTGHFGCVALGPVGRSGTAVAILARSTTVEVRTATDTGTSGAVPVPSALHNTLSATRDATAGCHVRHDPHSH